MCRTAGVMKARELVADDVIYSLNRLKTAKKAIPLYLDFIGKMEAPDKYTVVINRLSGARTGLIASAGDIMTPSRPGTGESPRRPPINGKTPPAPDRL